MLLSEFLSKRGRNRKKARAYVNYEGYIMVYHPTHPRSRKNGYVLAHYYFWEKYNNACLLPWSKVIHLNRNKKDNSNENMIAKMRTIP